ncbi:Ubiquinone biosynthesis protein [Pleurotus pulmonarius]|nr:Ubiquinone biosynthesis protein [Pleurotus pulmonarius]
MMRMNPSIRMHPNVCSRKALMNIFNRGAIHYRHQSTKPAYEGHIPLNWFENAILAAGSAFMSLANPRRGDMVAALAETTAGPSLPRLRDLMLESEEGRRILKERPRVNTSTVDMDKLAKYPEGTFGRAYCRVFPMFFLRTDLPNHLPPLPPSCTPSTYRVSHTRQVHYISDPELAYVMQRYRECHDFYHCITNLPVNVSSELAVKYFEFANLGLPMTAIAALFGPLRLRADQRTRLFAEFVPWALKCGGSARSLITVYWEKRWDQDIGELKKELGIWDPPEVKWGKPLKEAQDAILARQKTPTNGKPSAYRPGYQ